MPEVYLLQEEYLDQYEGHQTTIAVYTTESAAKAAAEALQKSADPKDWWYSVWAMELQS